SAPNFGHPYGYVAAVDHVFAGEEEDVSLQAGKWLTHNFTQEELQETLNRANTGNPGALVNPFGGLNNDGDCFDMVDARAYILNNSAVIGGVARQIAATASSSEHEGAATPVDTAISGYNAING